MGISIFYKISEMVCKYCNIPIGVSQNMKKLVWNAALTTEAYYPYIDNINVCYFCFDSESICIHIVQ